MQQGFDSLEAVGLGDLLIRAPADDARKAHGDARAVAS